MSEKKKKGGLLVPLLIIFVVIPGIVMAGAYFLFPSIKQTVNGALSNLPGPVGTYFLSQPTAEETDAKIKQIAEYMLKVEQNRAVDKMIIIKKDNADIYDQVLKTMLRINPNQTKMIMEQIRANTLSKDSFANTLDQINKEQAADFKKEAKFLEGLTTTTALEEVKFLMGASINGYKDVARAMENMDPIIASKIVEKLDKDLYKKLIFEIEPDKAAKIRTEITNRQTHVQDLKNAAQLYASEEIGKLVGIIGNTTTYPMEELANIYYSLGPVKSGKVLAQVKEDAFISDLTKALRDKAVAETGKDNITKDMLKSLKIFKDFSDNVNELVTVYEKMQTPVVAEVLKSMMRNSSEPKVYKLDNGENIVITDEDLALAIMRKFSKKKVGEILSTLDSTLSSEMTRKLALPQL